MQLPLRTGPWKMTDLQQVEKNGLTVFSCFHCGGGSSFGYKLAGYDVLGGVEIDPQMMNIYRKNHAPRFTYQMGVQEFRNIEKRELPPELFDLDILDGSPPCSSFSISGTRDYAWGDKKKFREGQAEQILDDLFFDYIAIGKTLQPKVIIAENVKGLIVGKARGYVKQIFAAFSDAGYDTQLFLLEAARMGVPQTRERTFFVARRKDLNVPALALNFDEAIIPFRAIMQREGPQLTPLELWLWEKRIHSDESLGEINKRHRGKKSNFNTKIQKSENVLCTVTAQGPCILYDVPRRLSDKEVILGQTFPDDFDFCGMNAKYIMGMSVPPFMMQRLSDQIAKQWFKK